MGKLISPRSSLRHNFLFPLIWALPQVRANSRLSIWWKNFRGYLACIEKIPFPSFALHLQANRLLSEFFNRIKFSYFFRGLKEVRTKSAWECVWRHLMKIEERMKSVKQVSSDCQKMSRVQEPGFRSDDPSKMHREARSKSRRVFSLLDDIMNLGITVLKKLIFQI